VTKIISKVLSIGGYPMQYKHLAQEERFLISKLLQAGCSRRSIARKLGRSHSTVIREVNRNKGKRGYRHKQADEFARRRRKEASSVPRKMTEELWAMIEQLIVQQRWSPEQIAGRLHLLDVASVSAKCIYERVWEDRACGGVLFRYLRRRGKKPNRRQRDGSGRGVIPGRVDISERPKEVEDKNRVGDWEADTIVGGGYRGALVSVVERVSKFVFLRKVGKKTAGEVGGALLRCLGPVRKLVRTITADNGKEFAGHRKVSWGLCAGFYFATPYHAWERGLNEHTNGLVREFFAKSRDLRGVEPQEVKKVEYLLNTRPRKALGYRTPEEVFREALESVGGEETL
jgi:IS30 family transposase